MFFTTKLIGWLTPMSKKLEYRLKVENDKEEKLADEMFERMKEKLMQEERMQKRVFNDYIMWKAGVLKKLKEQIGKCEKCQRTDLPLTIDHIIPVFILRDLGRVPELERDERNFRVLCKLCNSLKGHHLDFTELRTKPLILEYLQAFPGTGLYPTKAEQEIASKYPVGLPSWFRKQYDRVHDR